MEARIKRGFLETRTGTFQVARISLFGHENVFPRSRRHVFPVTKACFSGQDVFSGGARTCFWVTKACFSGHKDVFSGHKSMFFQSQGRAFPVHKNVLYILQQKNKYLQSHDLVLPRALHLGHMYIHLLRNNT